MNIQRTSRPQKNQVCLGGRSMIPFLAGIFPPHTYCWGVRMHVGIVPSPFAEEEVLDAPGSAHTSSCWEVFMGISYFL